MLVNVTVEINRHEQCDSHDPASIPKTFLIWCSPWYELMMDSFLRADESPGLTSVWDLLELLFAEILQFVSQLTDRFSQTIRRDKRTEEIVIYICRFSRCWERLETLQKTEIKTHQLHTSPNNLHQHQIVRLLLTWLIFSTHLNPALSQHQLHSSHIHYIN